MTPRVRRSLLGILAGLVIGFVVVVSTSRGLTTIRGGRLGGDLPGFYAAARILRAGEPGRLYDWQAQRDAESDLLPGSDEGGIPFVYPPYVAALYFPLILLPFKGAYAVYTLLMACCCVLAVRLLRPLLPFPRQDTLLAITATLAFYPLFRAVLGGQNTPISLLCFAGAASALTRGGPLNAGLWVGAALFKPQLALSVAALVTLRTSHRLRFIAGIAAVAILYYALGAAIGGAGWPVWWWRAAAAFASVERSVNRTNSIALIELAYAYRVSVAGWLAAAGVVAYVAWIAWRREPDPVTLVGLASAAAVLIAPHALYYDGGLSVIALLVAASRRPSLVPIIAVAWLLSWLQPLRGALPIPPMTVITAASLWLAVPDRSAPVRIADRNDAADGSAFP